MSSELLLEVRTDPMPPGVVEAGTQRLKNRLVQGLRAAGFAPRQSATGFTARRLLILFRGMTGPSGSGSAADAMPVLAQVVQKAVEGLSWPTTMRWQQDFEWLSPVRGLLLLLDGERVPARVFGIESSRETVGPESAGGKRLAVRDADHYGRSLADLGIEVRFPERRRILQEMLVSEAQRYKGELVQDAVLLRERAVACETAGVISVAIGRQFQTLPRELIQECVRDRLFGFCIAGKGDSIKAASFVLDRWDDPDGAVVRSYQWALASYLDDLRFFLERDRRVPLAERCREQHAQTASATLGTHGERAERCIELCDRLCEELGWSAERDRAKEAVGLLSADSRTELLRAFPGLEGVIGGLLAREEGYATSVWQALADSRRAAVDSKSLPRGRVGKLVALADRIDRLSSALASSEGRALASGEFERNLDGLIDQIVRIALGGGMAIDLELIMVSSLRQRLLSAIKGQSEDRDDAAMSQQALVASMDQLHENLADSIDRVFRELGFSSQEIAAVMLADGSSLLADQLHRLEGLRSLRGDPRLVAVAQTANRIAGILQGSTEQELDVSLLSQGSERDLYFIYRRLVDRVVAARDSGSFADWLQQMTDLNEHVDRFLRDVLVRDENERLRVNRLALLQRLHWLYAGDLRLAELLEGEHGV